jgi:ribosomal protein L22
MVLIATTFATLRNCLARRTNNSLMVSCSLQRLSTVGKSFSASTIRTSSSETKTRPSINVDSIQEPTPTRPSIVTTDDGRTYAAFDFPVVFKKLKPYIVARRINRLRSYEDKEKNIRHSPWRMNLVCHLAAGLQLPEAIEQLQFCKKSKAPLLEQVLKRVGNTASEADGLVYSQLEVAECFATHGTHLKRMKIMGRGRTGVMHHRHTHIRVVLREIDFKLKIYQAPTLNQKKKWFLRQMAAEREASTARNQRAELEELEEQERAIRAKRDKSEK